MSRSEVRSFASKKIEPRSDSIGTEEALAERERDGRHPALGSVCRYDRRRADPGCPGAAAHHRLGFRRTERSIHDLDRRRLSNGGTCTDGAKRGGDAHQPVRHLPMADLEGEGMKKGRYEKSRAVAP